MATAEPLHYTQQDRAGANAPEAVVLEFRKGSPARIEHPERFEQTVPRRYLFEDIETEVVLTAVETAVFRRMLEEPAAPHAGLAALLRRNP
jgi:hypothetical protein